MRDLNECTAEVVRRGEQRIKERRRMRGRVFAVCIPVCLIAAVWSVISLPAMMPAMESVPQDRFTGDGETAGNAPGSFVCPYTAVEIQDAGAFPAEHDGKVTDRLAVDEMFGAIHALFAEADGNGTGQNAIGNLPAEETNGSHDFADAPGKSKEYTITFTAEDGSRAVYRLSGNTLVNAETKETMILSDSQTAGLLSALGISE